MKRSRRILYITFGLLILLLGIPCLLTYREAMRLERNRALIHAIRQKDAVSVHLLLRQGADPNARELPQPPSGTLLQRLQALLDLLRHGQPKPPSDAPSALMLAVEADSAPIAIALLNAGATDVNAKIKSDVSGTSISTPLLVRASAAGNREMVGALLDRGADINAPDTQGETALISAAFHIPTYYSYREETRAPWEAACKTHTAVVKLLLERGANVNAGDTQGQYTALWHAAENDATEIVIALLNHGADPNLGDEGWSVLDWAVYYSDLPMVKALLDKGAWVRPEEHGQIESPLTVGGDVDILRLLLEKGANIHARKIRGKYSGETALIFLARHDYENDNLKAIQLLLASGADVNETDDPENGMTALMWAAQYAGMDTFRYLLDHGAKVNLRGWGGSALLWAIEDGGFDKARLLLERGADVNIPDEDGVTPLMRTAEWGEEDFALELLRHGAKVNDRDKGDSTALHYAAEDNNDAMVELLLDWGAKVNARDKEGHTPLTNVKANDEQDTSEVVKILREAGGKE